MARLKVLRNYGPKRLKRFSVQEAAQKIYQFSVKHNVKFDIGRMSDVMFDANYRLYDANVN